MTRLSLAGIALVATGLALLIFQPQTRTCVTDYDLTICQVATSAFRDLAGLVFIAVGGTLAVFGLPKRLS